MLPSSVYKALSHAIPLYGLHPFCAYSIAIALGDSQDRGYFAHFTDWEIEAHELLGNVPILDS